jgi:hypothetical protein
MQFSLYVVPSVKREKGEDDPIVSLDRIARDRDGTFVRERKEEY